MFLKVSLTPALIQANIFDREPMKPNHSRFASLFAIGALTLPCSHAAIMLGDGTEASVTAGTNVPELVLIVWDRTAKVSYTKDLGIAAYATNYALGDTTKNLHVYGQQDTGYQKLFDALNTDTNFQSFLSASSGVANQTWAIIAAEANSDISIGAGSHTLFTTLMYDPATPAGGTNSHYIDLTGKDANGNPVPGPKFENTPLGDAVGNIGFWANDISTIQSATNTHGSLANGSSFDLEVSLGYAGKLFSGLGGGIAGNGSGKFFNPVGQSSWFYRATVSSETSDASPDVDEFDNGVLGNGHDAYWGLGVDTNGNYILSYTMEASLTQALTASGLSLRLRTDFAANYGGTRLIGAPAGDTLNLGNVSAVPEPSTWGLMGLGLALLAARARRRA